MVACSPVTQRPRVQSPVVHRRGLWRLPLHPLTLETVYLSWVAWPCKWWSRPTDLEWDIKEPLSMTHSLAVTTLSFPIHLNYILHIHAGCQGVVTMACDFGLKGLEYGSWLPRFGAVSLARTLHLYVHSRDPGMNGYLVGQWLLACLNSYQRHDGSRAVCFPGSWVGTGMNRPYKQGKFMWSA